MTDKPSLQDRLVAAGFGAGWALVPRLPERLTAWAFRTAADRLWKRRGRSVLRLEANLARVKGTSPDDPGVRELSREGMRSYFRYFHEVFRLPSMSAGQLLARTHVVGDAQIYDNLARGRGVVFALPHMGNWDQAGAWFVAKGHPFTTVAERLRPESLFHRYTAFREGLGMEVLPLTGGESHTFGTLAQRLRAGRPVALPAERDLTAKGVEVQFFGAATRMPAGPGLLAVHTGAALIPAILSFKGDDWVIHFHDEIVVPAEGDRKEKVAAVMQSLATVFEKGIAEHPQDWHMLQRLWLEDLEPRD
ncbi:phosphatidylinositol mannoside acyltransferase [Streptosporangium sp. NBC_01639]|uniref:phosphatidylinositol mannoside acyltransferase n=1 Tax=unclassified Streptosporangium TaxID=2632669 RepID=UPI002DDAD6CA|nr:phosphatidylinositol mannoside acyltransferase [Streptosporangium sp. NBC_01756]WSC87264.1 phosphatidylinositol mannoside acyltransferase [Streptosporangium sp. NBC_01756]WTD54046.1 phosphatidylinositol mannoside acyltransferase [Streptosporangium sp. NBC_01639]